MSYTMIVNKKYVLTTNQNTILSRRVKVLGIVNYEECIKTSFDIYAMAQNEKVLFATETDDEAYIKYLNTLEYYKCEDLDNGSLVIVWSDIINSKKTSLIDEEYLMKVAIKLPLNTSNPISMDNFMVALKDFAASKYGVGFNYELISSDDYTEADKTKDLLAEAQIVIKSLASFKSIAPVIDNLYTNNISKKLTDIGNEISTIGDKVAIISAGI